MSKGVYDVTKVSPKLRRELLGRCVSDCEYFLGGGNRSEKHLWGITAKDHIQFMKDVFNTLSDKDKPEWLSWSKILEYEKKMLLVG